MSIASSGLLLLIALQPPGLAGAAAPPVTAEPPRIAAVALAVQGLDLEALRQALELRAPALRIVLGPCADRCVAVTARRGPDGMVELNARLGDGRVFVRSLAALDEPERVTATSLAHLFAAIEDGTATPVEAQPPAPAAPAPPEVQEELALPPAPARVESVVRAPSPVAPARRLELAAAVGLAWAAGVGPPRTLAGWVGTGLAVDVELRTRRGLLVALGSRALQQRDSGHRLQRVRVGAAIGYGLRRGRFELRALAGVTVEPWWVTRRADGTRRDSGTTLLGGTAVLAPGVTASLGPGLGLRVGLRVEAAASAGAGTSSAIQANDGEGRPLFRLGGFELGALAELGLRWDLGAPR